MAVNYPDSVGPEPNDEEYYTNTVKWNIREKRLADNFYVTSVNNILSRQLPQLSGNSYHNLDNYYIKDGSIWRYITDTGGNIATYYIRSNTHWFAMTPILINNSDTEIPAIVHLNPGTTKYNLTEKEFSVYDGTEWIGIGGSIIVSTRPPDNAKPGNVWFESDTGKLAVAVKSENGAVVWVEAGGGGGSTGELNVPIVQGQPTTPTNLPEGSLQYDSIGDVLYVLSEINGAMEWWPIGGPGYTPKKTPIASGTTNPDPNTAGLPEGSLFYNITEKILYVLTEGVWKPIGGAGYGGSVTIPDPANVGNPNDNHVAGVNGNLYYDYSTGDMYVYYDDDNDSATPNWHLIGGGDVIIPDVGGDPNDNGGVEGVNGDLYYDYSTGDMYVYYDDNDPATPNWHLIGIRGGTVYNITNNDILNVNTKNSIDTTGGPLTIILPENPNVGDWVEIFDVGGCWSINNLTVSTNSKKVHMGDGPLICDVSDAHIKMSYTGVSYGWAIS